MKFTIIIPARFGSTRLPGKPLMKICGVPMLKRVVEIANYVAQPRHIPVWVSTEDQRIIDYCESENIPAVKTSETCENGTERAAMTLQALSIQPDAVINLQGDNPICPPWFLERMLDTFEQQTDAQVVTPFVYLDWDELDQFRQEKLTTPLSGTTMVLNQASEALWFSKQILPTLRNEAKLRKRLAKSPVARHIGLYGYRRTVLEQLEQLKPTAYADYEGLEQLVFLENKICIQGVEVDYQGRQGLSGVDSAEDLSRAEKIIQEDGELISL